MNIAYLESKLGEETLQQIKQLLREAGVPEYDPLYTYALIYHSLSQDARNLTERYESAFNNFFSNLDNALKKAVESNQNSLFEQARNIEQQSTTMCNYTQSIQTALQDNLSLIKSLPQQAADKIIDNIEKIEHKFQNAEQLAKLEVEKVFYEGVHKLSQFNYQQLVNQLQKYRIYTGILAVVLLAGSFGLGWLLGNSRYDGRGFVRMTPEEQLQFFWAISTEGRRARQLWEWNRDNIDDCQREQNQNSGACYLWVVPKHQRKKAD